jgi:hypothetical protein
MAKLIFFWQKEIKVFIFYHASFTACFLRIIWALPVADRSKPVGLSAPSPRCAAGFPLLSLTQQSGN